VVEIWPMKYVIFEVTPCRQI